jgi:hypothetical protein
MPRVDSHMVLPKSLALIIERILLRNDKACDGLPWIRFRIPYLPRILNRLVIQILAKLHLEEIFSFMRGMEVLQPEM